MRKVAIDPGAGYRLLGDDEESVAGDEYVNLRSNGTSMNNWNTVYGLAGYTARSEGFTIAFRRKVEAPLEQHFI